MRSINAILLFAAIICSSPLAAWAAPEKGGVPELIIAESVHNFGSVVQGTKVEHSFEITNTGDAPLLIKAIQPACGCTAAVVGKDTLAPNEKTEIHAAFDTTGFHGYKVKTIRIHTNDPKQSSAVVGFQGTVRMDVELDQPRVYFGRVTKGKGDHRTFSVRPGKDSSAKILDISGRSEHLEINVEDIEGGAKKVTVGLKDSVPLGVFKSRVVVRTTSERNPVINVPVFARVEGDLKVIPPDVSFGLVEGPLEKPISHKLRLVNEGSAPLQILGVKSSNPAVEVTLEKVTPGREYLLIVTVGSGAVGTLRGQITITTDHPSAEQTQIELPLYGVITRKGD